MNATHLPGIKKVGVCKSKNLQPDIYDLIDELKTLKVYGAFTDIPIVDLGAISVKSEIVKGVTVYTTSAKFMLCVDDESAKKLCRDFEENDSSYYFETINGIKFLVGTHEKPRPTAKAVYQNDENTSGKRGYVVEITYVNTHSFLVLD